MAWAQVESQLFLILSQLMTRESTNEARYFVVHNIWSAIVSFEARMKVIHGVVDANVKDEIPRDDWSLLYNYTIKMSAGRNQVAHGHVINVDNKRVVLQPFLWNRPRRHEGLSIDDLDDRTGHFVELARSLEWINQQFSPFVREHPEEGGPVPSLVLRLRKQASRSRAKQKTPAKPAR